MCIVAVPDMVPDCDSGCLQQGNDSWENQNDFSRLKYFLFSTWLVEWPKISNPYKSALAARVVPS